MNFLQKIYKKSKEQKGFTLVEMIVVLVIIAILAAITIPALLKYIDKARDKQIVIDARTAYLAAETAVSEAYASNAMPTKNPITFGSGASAESDPKDKAFQDNAHNLTGVTKTYKCKVTLNGNEISQIEFEEDSKVATMNVSAGGSWTVSKVAITNP